MPAVSTRPHGAPGLRLRGVTAEHFEDYGELLTALQTAVRDAMDGRSRPLHMLEAGCGDQRSPLGLDADDVRIVGIDVSALQLQRNSWADEKILGDVQSYAFAPEAFDVVACWDVLEHLPSPRDALARFAHAVRTDGIIALGAPNPDSAKGLITKFTPHRVHVWYYRQIVG